MVHHSQSRYSQIGMAGGADSEADSPRDRLLAVERLQLRSKQVAREAETAGLLVEHRHQVVRYAVAVCVCGERKDVLLASRSNVIWRP